MSKTIIKLSILAIAAASAVACSSDSAAVNNQTANKSAVVVNNNTGTASAAANTNAGIASQTATAGAPDALVADLYKQRDAKKSPFFQSKDRALVDKYFAKATADKIWKDAVDSKGEMGAIGADPLYNAQDTEIKNFTVGKSEITGSKAAVPVTFENFGKKQTVNYALAQENGSWKIEDIKYTEGKNLVGMYK